MRGGFRPGAGRKPGSKDKKPRQQSEQHNEQREEAAKIRKMLSFDIMAKRKFYQEYLTRVNNKDKEGKPLGL
ncbi:MAG: hypothetical protein NTV01_05610, partial [Bacteroidia bacterium]|nr:hypothetical protein [Bacteroidia bacterium]